MKAPLYQALKDYGHSPEISFHMPGHKNGNRLPDLNGLDITELPGFDNLHNPEGLIYECQRQMAETFGAEESFLLVNGSTAGLMAAIGAVCGQDERIIIARNAHVAVFRGLAFSGASPVYCVPPVTQAGVPGCIAPAAIEKMLQEDRTIKGVCIVSPTYEGFVSDIQTLADICHRYKAALIVDEAHGAHFVFHSYFPDGALKNGADIVIQSMHKTLAVPTGCALCHVQGDLVDRDRLKKLLSFFQTTSPSYLLMGAMDYARGLLAEEGPALFAAYIQSLAGFRSEMENLRQIKLLDGAFMAENAIFDLDRGKLLFYLPEKGKALFEALSSRYKIRAEMHGRDTLLCMSSYANTPEHFTLLQNAIAQLDRTMEKMPCPQYSHDALQITPVVDCSPREALFKKTESVTVKEALGRICGEYIIPYPPGIPLIVPGERFTASVLAVFHEKQYLLAQAIIKDRSLARVEVLAD